MIFVVTLGDIVGLSALALLVAGALVWGVVLVVGAAWGRRKKGWPWHS